MSDKPWKAWERRVAALLGGKRRGADTRGENAGKDDVIHPHFSVECKLLSRPCFADLLAAARQSEANARQHQEPIAVVKRKGRGQPDGDALVVQRFQTFIEWRVGQREETHGEYDD